MRWARTARGRQLPGAFRTCARTDRGLAQALLLELAVVAAYSDIGHPVTFYSPDHPAVLTPDEPWSSGLTSLEEAQRSGFIGICETGDWKLEKSAKAWMKIHAANAERMVITTRRFNLGRAGAASVWNVFFWCRRRSNKRRNSEEKNLGSNA